MYYYHKISKPLSEKLDLSRALAALIVMLVHLRGSFFVQFSDLEPSSQHFMNYFSFFVTRVGHECVIVFFVLSGFLVGGNYLSDFINNNAEIKKYFINRIVRMWMVLIPALVLVYFLSIVDYNISHSGSFLDEISWKIFFGNLFFLQNVAVPSFGGNSPLWSLTNEFWYYILWPISLYLLFSSGKKIVKTIILLLLVLVLSYYAPNVMRLFVLWVLGAIIRFIPSFKLLSKQKTLIFTLSLFFVFVAYSNIYQNFIGEYAVGISFSLLLLYWMYSEKSYHPFIQKNIAWLANISFSVYAIHFSFLFIVMWLFRNIFLLDIRLKDASLINWFYYSIAAVLMVFLCWLFYIITEKHTYRVRKFIYSKAFKDKP